TGPVRRGEGRGGDGLVRHAVHAVARAVLPGPGDLALRGGWGRDRGARPPRRQRHPHRPRRWHARGGVRRPRLRDRRRTGGCRRGRMSPALPYVLVSGPNGGGLFLRGPGQARARCISVVDTVGLAATPDGFVWARQSADRSVLRVV